MNLDKGIELERKAACFLWNNKYWVRMRTPIFLDDEKRVDITDIDVLGFHFDENLNLTKWIIDCKHDEKGFAQLINTSGLSNLMEINFSYSIRKKVTREIRQFANLLHIKVFEIDRFEAILPNNNIGVFSDASMQFAKNQITELTKQENRFLKNTVYLPLQKSLLNKDPFERFKMLYSLNGYLFENYIKNIEDNDLLKWLSYEIVLFTAYTLIECSSKSIDCPENKLKADLNSKLITSSYSLSQRKEFLKKLKNIGTILEKCGVFQNVDLEKSFEDTSPTYIESFSNIVKILINRRVSCQKYLRFIDFITYEYVLKNKSVDMQNCIRTLGIFDSEVEFFKRLNLEVVLLLNDGKTPLQMKPIC